jgi:hypothetical protein
MRPVEEVRVRRRCRRDEGHRTLRQDTRGRGHRRPRALDAWCRVEPVLAAPTRAGGERFKSIRHITAWDADSSVLNPGY